MTWQELGALGELTGAFAAVVLLGYIAYQIRQNSRLLEQNARSTRAASLQAGNEFFARAWALVAQDPTLARIWRRVRAGETINEDETVRFEALLTVFMAYVEHAYVQAEIGAYDVDVLAVGGTLISDALSSPPARNWWQRDGQRTFRPEFSQAVNRLLGASKDAPE
jgi:hypothetical protein